MNLVCFLLKTLPELHNLFSWYNKLLGWMNEKGYEWLYSVGCVGETRNPWNILVGKSEGQVWRRRKRKWEDNIKCILKKEVWGSGLDLSGFGQGPMTDSTMKTMHHMEVGFDKECFKRRFLPSHFVRAQTLFFHWLWRTARCSFSLLAATDFLEDQNPPPSTFCLCRSAFSFILLFARGRPYIYLRSVQKTIIALSTRTCVLFL